MATYRELTGAGVPTRAAAGLVGVPRATATRTPRTPVLVRGRVPANKLNDIERARVLAVVNCSRFVDLPRSRSTPSSWTRACIWAQSPRSTAS